VLRSSRERTVAFEAGSPFGWERHAGHVVGIDRFGVSAPGSVAMAHLGIDVESLVARLRQVANES